MNKFRCEECGSYSYSDIEGIGDDFTDYWCSECDTLTRVFDDEVE